MTDADDWEPLPEAQRVAHPGELLELRAAPRAPVPEPPPLAPPPPRDPVAEQALRYLETRIAKGKQATSLVAEVLHRERRVERRAKRQQQAVAAHERAAAAVVTSQEPEAKTTAAVEFDTRAADKDPRETEPWFADLPRPVQERLRTHWWHERHHDDDAGVRLRKRLGRALMHGAGLFLVLSVLQAPLMGGFGLVPPLTAAGALGAMVAEVCGGGRVLYAVAGAGAFTVVMGVAVFVQPLGMMSLMLAAYGMGTLGMDGEMRRSGGFEAK